MPLKEIIEELQKIYEEYGNIEFETSVDMSVSDNEDTYTDRVFGRAPYLVRTVLEHDEDGFIKRRYAQILFEYGYDNRAVE